MSSVKKIHKIYAVWDFELEVEELDLQSEQGWQLLHGGLFSRTYEKDDTVLYRHQLDYNANADSFYMEMFRDQGWEYVNSTVNGWNYFRKKVTEELTEDDYVIYTDVDSKKGMNRRFLKMMLLVFAAVMLANLNQLVRFLEAPKIATSGIFFVYIIYGFFLVKSIVGLRRTAKGIKPKRRTPIELYFLALIFSVVIMIQGISSSFTMQYGMQGAKEDHHQEFTYHVDFPDMHYISMSKISSDVKNISVKLKIENEKGELVYHNPSFGMDEKRVGIFLRSGSYQCIIDGDIDERYWIEIK